MSPPLDLKSADGMLEECVDLIDECVAMDRYPEAVLALAFKVHLGNLLRALLERDLCTREDVRTFLLDLEQEALRDADD